MTNLYATEVLHSFIPDTVFKDPETGLTWLYVSYDGTYEDFLSRPKVVEYQDKYFLRCSHNSDSYKMNYKETAKHLIGQVIK
jgi:hypothetical protein